MTAPLQNPSFSEPLRMLLVEDDPSSMHLVERLVEKEGFQIATSSNAEEAEQMLPVFRPHLVLADVVLPGMSGLALLTKIREQHPQTEVILLTGHASVERAVEAIRDGACDYIEKPLDRSRLLAALRKAKQQIALRLENLDLRNQLSTHAREMLVGQSASILEIRQMVERIACNDMNVFIEGESGTGKEIVAEMIHRLSPRARHPFIKISCAAIPENLLESEMFGHEKGAFTGAAQSRAGKFEMAHQGVLFLDEIGEMNPNLQAKFLRVLQNGEFTRLGGNGVRAVDVRVVSATNVKVEQAISAGKFREDLLYRLNVVHLRMPPLRERLDDIPLLVAHFLAGIKRRLALDDLEISPAALKHLQTHSWPGNVRQLANVVERGVALRRKPILEVSDFELEAPTIAPRTPPSSQPGEGGLVHRSLGEGGSNAEPRLYFEPGITLEEMERRMIQAAIKACGGDKERAAAMLGISARTIYRKLGEQ